MTARSTRAPLALLALLASVGVACSNDDGGSSGGCPEGQRLVDGRCETTGGRDIGNDNSRPDAGEDPVELPEGCQEGERLCSDSRTEAICQSDATFTFNPCNGEDLCRDGFCIDSGLTCTPGVNIGCDDGDSYRVCNGDGTNFDVVDCPSETPNCLGSGTCSSGICIANQRRCSFDADDIVEECSGDGEAWNVVETCEAGLTCDAGECLSPCEENAKLTSFLGCDYWAADLDNIDDAAAQQFSVSVSNPNDDPVTVTIRNGATDAVTTETVDPNTVRAINLARLDVDGTSLSRNAYHITTNLPVTMHQFNPANNVGVFSNDASLLLPTNSGGLRYVVLDWPTGPFGSIGNTAASYATVIAVAEGGPTTVQVTPSVAVRVGTGVNAMAAGSTSTVTLNHGDVLNLETQAQEGRDLSGTIIESDAPILVFAGHECAFVPDDTPYCDHMEQQLYPVEAWGDRYFGGKTSPRGTEVDVWRVVTAEPNTVLTTSPPVSGVNGRTLQPGEVLQFQTNQSFELEATAPVLVGQFITGSNYPGIPQTCPVPTGSFPCGSSCPFGYSCTELNGQCVVTCSNNPDCAGLLLGEVSTCFSGYCTGTGIGDPAFMLSVPVQQYRDNYIFLTPSGYREDYITVIAPLATELTLDGAPLLVSALTPISDSGYGVAYHDLSSTGGSDPAAAHTITGSNAFALQVYGYDCDVSYAYPGGLNLEAEEE